MLNLKVYKNQNWLARTNQQAHQLKISNSEEWMPQMKLFPKMQDSVETQAPNHL